MSAAARDSRDGKGPPDPKLDAWGLARALGETLVRTFCEQRRAERYKRRHPSYRKGRREDALKMFGVHVINGGETIEIRCRDSSVADWEDIKHWHERLVDAPGFVPVIAIVVVSKDGRV